jgi:hypothetical protein
MFLSQQERLSVFCIQNIVMAGKKNPRRTGKTGNKGKEMGIAESVLDEESDDDLHEDADFAGKLLFGFNSIRSDIQEPHNVLLLLPTSSCRSYCSKDWTSHGGAARKRQL